MKHKKLKWMMSLLLLAVLVLGMICGCSGKGGEQTGTEDGGGGSSQDGSTQDSGAQAMGRFQEEEIDTGVEFETIYDIKKLEDGTIRIIGKDLTSGVWDSKDQGKTWEKAYDFPEEVQERGGFLMNEAALSSDGQAVCAFDDITDGTIKEVLYLIDKDGKADRIPFELPKAEKNPNGMTNGISDLHFTGNEQIVLQDSAGTVYQVNVSDGNVKHKYEPDPVTDKYQIFAVGNTLIAQNYSKVLLYDLKTGRESSEEALDKGSAENGNFSAVDTLDAGESIYCLSKGGLYHYKFGGSVMEELIDGSMNTLGVSSFYPAALAMIDEQNLLVVGNDPYSNSVRGNKVWKYTYSADSPVKPDKELKVYSLYENDEIRQNISRFQKEYGDVYVNYQVALSEENGMTVSDALKVLTTEIMAGNGPDVLLLDGMPVDAYIERGILKDLSPLLKESGVSYFENIINAYQDDQGQICAVPARFLIPMIYADSAYYMPGEDFDAFTERKDTMVHMQPWEVVQKFWYTCGTAWQKDDRTLDEAKMTEFLSKLKNAYGEYDSSMEDIDNEYYSKRNAAYVLTDLSLELRDYEFAEGKFNTNFGLCRTMDYGMEQAINELLNDGKRGLMPGQADHVFVPCMVMGISGKSGQPEIAEEFVKYMFSQEVQGVSKLVSYFVEGFPVGKEAFRSFIDGHEVSSGTAQFVDDIVLVLGPAPEEAITEMTELVEFLTTPALMDEVILDVVVEQGEKVLKGEISPEEGTAAIMQKVNIYLAE